MPDSPETELIVEGPPLEFTVITHKKTTEVVGLMDGVVPEVAVAPPHEPEAREEPVRPGGCDVVTVKLEELVAVPPGAETEIGPVVAPEGTVAVIWVSETTVKLVELTALKVTSVAPVKPEPTIVTEVPSGPEVGEKLVIESPGGGGGPPVEGIGSGVAVAPLLGAAPSANAEYRPASRP